MSTLYLNYFGLNSPPFSITPDPSFFFEGEDKGVFIAGLLHAAVQADGIVLVIGEVGSGKTMMSRLLLTRLPDNVDTVYLPNPSFSRDEIIDVIARDLGIAAANQGVRLEVLQQELIKRHSLGRQVVVLVDEAHAMPAESIEEIRRLSNLETDDRKLVQLILCGQPELDTLLAAPHLRQVRDRVVYRLTLRNLSQGDSSAYLDHRLRVAGWRGGRMFSWMGERLLLRDARGRARRLNLIADKALLAAFAEGKKQVNARHVRLAIRDVGANFSSAVIKPNQRWQVTAAWLCSLVLTAIAAVWLTTLLNRGKEATTGNKITLPAALYPGLDGVANHSTDAATDKTASYSTDKIPGHSSNLPGKVGKEGVLHTQPADTLAADYQSASGQAAKGESVAREPLDRGLENRGTLHEFHVNDLEKLVKQSYLNAQQQAALGSYAIRLASVRRESDVGAFISVANKTLAPEHIYVRRFSADHATWYAIYFGNIPSPEAADRVITGLAKELIGAKPTICTWKKVLDADWTF